ncbi:unnamed protein product [Prorocentrum cordatum]|uniref:Uncharacterized protein n=1 Tax=Prorocentrum cordatum TaxID=2364126 RepID=A0ABN9Y0N0_9DINO|nr:unnamed protein product [Polarella glacialis]
MLTATLEPIVPAIAPGSARVRRAGGDNAPCRCSARRGRRFLEPSDIYISTARMPGSLCARQVGSEGSEFPSVTSHSDGISVTAEATCLDPLGRLSSGPSRGALRVSA